MRTHWLPCLCLLAAATTVHGIGIQILNTEIDPAPNQPITVMATGAGELMGVDLFFLATGANLVLTDISIEDSLWMADADAGVFVYPDDPTSPQLAYAFVTGTGITPGVIATIVVDATGLDGQQAVITGNAGTGMVCDYCLEDYSCGTADPIVDGTITIRGSSVDQPPVVDAGTAQNVTSGATVTLAGTATDPESATMTYSWAGTSGPAVTLSNADSLTPTFTAPDVTEATPIVLELAVSDGTSTVTDTVTITVYPAAANLPPAVEAGPDQTVISGSTVTLAGTASDPENDPLSYAWTRIQGPAVTLSNAAILTASFVAPEVDESTAIVLQLAVTDGTTTQTDTVTITVAPEPDKTAPTVDAGEAQTVTSGDTVALAGTASDPETAALTYTWTRVSGPEITLDNADTLTPSFVAPAVSESTTITLQLAVSDGTNTATDTVTITVAPAINTPPTVDAGPAQTVTSGDTVVLTGTVSDAEQDSLTYAWTRTAGPSFTLTGANTSTLSFVAPTVTKATTIRFQLTVSDGTNTVSDTVIVVINPASSSDDDSSGDDSSDDGNDSGTDTSTDTSTDDQSGRTTTTLPTCGSGVSQAVLACLAGLTILGLAPVWCRIRRRD
jgi:hypothetical protein